MKGPSGNFMRPGSGFGGGWAGGQRAPSLTGGNLLGPTPVNAGGGPALADGPGNSFPGPIGNDLGGPISGGAPMAAAASPGVADWLEMRNAAGPQHGLDEFGSLPGPKEMAIGAIPHGIGSMGGALLSGLMTGKDNLNSSQKFGLATSIMGGGFPAFGPVIEAVKWLTGLPQVQANPIATWSGAGTNLATGPADALFRAGGTPQQMQTLYDRVMAEYNKGGAGDPYGVGQHLLGLYGGGYQTGADIAYTNEPGQPQPYGVTDEGVYIYEPGANSVIPVTSEPLGPVGEDSGAIDSASWDSDPGDNAAIAEAMGSDWFSKGGIVGKRKPGKPDPAGPDNQLIGAQTGEGVLSRQAMRRIGPEMFAALNSGKIDGKSFSRAALPVADRDRIFLRWLTGMGFSP